MVSDVASIKDSPFFRGVLNKRVPLGTDVTSVVTTVCKVNGASVIVKDCAVLPESVLVSVKSGEFVIGKVVTWLGSLLKSCSVESPFIFEWLVVSTLGTSVGVYRVSSVVSKVYILSVIIEDVLGKTSLAVSANAVLDSVEGSNVVIAEGLSPEVISNGEVNSLLKVIESVSGNVSIGIDVSTLAKSEAVHVPRDVLGGFFESSSAIVDNTKCVEYANLVLVITLSVTGVPRRISVVAGSFGAVVSAPTIENATGVFSAVMVNIEGEFSVNIPVGSPEDASTAADVKKGVISVKLISVDILTRVVSYTDVSVSNSVEL